MARSIQDIDVLAIGDVHHDAVWTAAAEFNPGLETTVGALANRLKLPQATVSREIARLAKAGLFHTRREGNRALVSAAVEASIAPELRSMLGKLYGPPVRIREALTAVPASSGP